MLRGGQKKNHKLKKYQKYVSVIMKHRPDRKKNTGSANHISRKQQKNTRSRLCVFLLFTRYDWLSLWFFFCSGDASLLQVHISGTTSTCGFFLSPLLVKISLDRVFIKNIPCSCPCYDMTVPFMFDFRTWVNLLKENYAKDQGGKEGRGWWFLRGHQW